MDNKGNCSAGSNGKETEQLPVKNNRKPVKGFFELWRV